jgi:hypothetical protein
MRPIKTSYPVWYRLCLRSDCDIEVIARVLVEFGRSRKDAKKSSIGLRDLLCVFAPLFVFARQLGQLIESAFRPASFNASITRR